MNLDNFAINVFNDKYALKQLVDNGESLFSMFNIISGGPTTKVIQLHFDFPPLLLVLGLLRPHYVNLYHWASLSYCF